MNTLTSTNKQTVTEKKPTFTAWQWQGEWVEGYMSGGSVTEPFLMIPNGGPGGYFYVGLGDWVVTNDITGKVEVVTDSEYRARFEAVTEVTNA